MIDVRLLLEKNSKESERVVIKMLSGVRRQKAFFL